MESGSLRRGPRGLWPALPQAMRHPDHTEAPAVSRETPEPHGMAPRPSTPPEAAVRGLSAAVVASVGRRVPRLLSLPTRAGPLATHSQMAAGRREAVGDGLTPPSMVCDSAAVATTRRALRPAGSAAKRTAESRWQWTRAGSSLQHSRREEHTGPGCGGGSYGRRRRCRRRSSVVAHRRRACRSGLYPAPRPSRARPGRPSGRRELPGPGPPASGPSHLVRAGLPTPAAAALSAGGSGCLGRPHEPANPRPGTHHVQTSKSMHAHAAPGQPDLPPATEPQTHPARLTPARRRGTAGAAVTRRAPARVIPTTSTAQARRPPRFQRRRACRFT